MVHTLRFFRFSPPREPGKATGCGPPPRQGPFALPCERATGGAAMCCLLSPPAGHTRVCCFFVLWCPTLQNYAVAGCAGLFAGFEKTSILCGFARCSYETPCRFLTFEIAILAIKNTTMKKHSNKEAQQQRNTVTKKHNNKETQ